MHQHEENNASVLQIDSTAFECSFRDHGFIKVQRKDKELCWDIPHLSFSTIYIDLAIFAGIFTSFVEVGRAKTIKSLSFVWHLLTPKLPTSLVQKKRPRHTTRRSVGQPEGTQGKDATLTFWGFPPKTFGRKVFNWAVALAAQDLVMSDLLDLAEPAPPVANTEVWKLFAAWWWL